MDQNLTFFSFSFIYFYKFEDVIPFFYLIFLELVRHSEKAVAPPILFSCLENAMGGGAW